MELSCKSIVPFLYLSPASFISFFTLHSASLRLATSLLRMTVMGSEAGILNKISISELCFFVAWCGYSRKTGQHTHIKREEQGKRSNHLRSWNQLSTEVISVNRGHLGAISSVFCGGVERCGRERCRKNNQNNLIYGSKDEKIKIKLSFGIPSLIYAYRSEEQGALTS